MPRVKGGTTHHRRQRAVLTAVRGHKQARRTRYQTARESLLHAMAYQTAHRRSRKRDFRALWVTRINAAARAHGLSYSRFVRGLILAGVAVDRKNLADLAVREPAAFAELATTARGALA
ncbi:MAG: 50S ribosomal protein L20 [SAR202 cluster bacterium]|nr:50S ribosomal protein L20 [SAR202 cluster bacterium]